MQKKPSVSTFYNSNCDSINLLKIIILNHCLLNCSFIHWNELLMVWTQHWNGQMPIYEQLPHWHSHSHQQHNGHDMELLLQLSVQTWYSWRSHFDGFIYSPSLTLLSVFELTFSMCIRLKRLLLLLFSIPFVKCQNDSNMESGKSMQNDTAKRNLKYSS